MSIKLIQLYLPNGRCRLVPESFNMNEELIFTHERYIYGEIVIIKDGKFFDNSLLMLVPSAFAHHLLASALSSIYLLTRLLDGKPG